MKSVAYIKKDKAVENYTAVTHDNVTAKVRQHFIEAGIALHPTLVSAKTEQTGKTTSKGNPYIRYEGLYDIAFVNIDDPADRIVVRIESHAEDTGDKAPGKAISYATKYATLKVLMLETGDADESRAGHETEDKALTEEQEKALQSLREASMDGSGKLKAKWQEIGKDNRFALAAHLDSLKTAAKEADAVGKKAA
jgi:hypothetical protein